MLAGGSCSRIYRAFRPATGHIFAVKVHRMEESDRDRAGGDAIRERLKLLEEFSHRHIVQHFGHDFVDQSLYIYLEMVPSGSLRRTIEEFGKFREPVLTKAAGGLFEGLDYLHSRTPPMVHGNINSSTILVADGWCLKLQCFQCSRHVVAEKSFATIESLQWLAPEVFQQRPADRRKADIWSAGCALLEMATAEAPWSGVSLDELLAVLGGAGGPLAGPLLSPRALTGAVRRCAVRCLRPCAARRPAARELADWLGAPR